LVDTAIPDVVSIAGAIADPVASAIRAVLLDYPGRWNVQVDRDLIGGWWLVTLTADGFERSVLVPPREQRPAAIESVVVEAVGSRAHPLRFVRCALERPRPARRIPTRRPRH
jgi:hypothetical protein